MHRFSRRPSLSAVLALAVVFALAALAGCASTAAGDDNPPPAARMERAGPHGALSVVLTPVGAQRAGIATAVAGPAAGAGSWSRTPLCSTSPTGAA